MAHYGRGDDETSLRGEEQGAPARPVTREALLRVPVPRYENVIDMMLRAAPAQWPTPGMPKPPAAIDRAFAVAKGVPIAPGFEAKVDFGRRMLKVVRKV